MFKSINGINVYYDFAGSGKPVVLLHGWGGQAESFKSVFYNLSRAYSVYVLDLPGFGKSDNPPEPWAIKNYAQFIIDFMNLIGLERASLIGHSFGGRISIMLAANSPERVDKLILVDSAGIRLKGFKYYYRRSLAKVGKFSVRLFGKSGEKLKIMLYHLAGSKDYLTAGEMRETFIKVVSEDLRYLLPKINAPTLIIWGEDDIETSLKQARIIKNGINKSILFVLKEAGHFSYIDQFWKFYFRVSDFLRE
jgi:pimeloyl-ACP methyl ester carboxylesterase